MSQKVIHINLSGNMSPIRFSNYNKDTEYSRRNSRTKYLIEPEEFVHKQYNTQRYNVDRDMEYNQFNQGYSQTQRYKQDLIFETAAFPYNITSNQNIYKNDSKRNSNKTNTPNLYRDKSNEIPSYQSLENNPIPFDHSSVQHNQDEFKNNFMKDSTNLINNLMSKVTSKESIEPRNDVMES